MKIEWFVQYYYSAEDVYKAKKMQWLVTIIEMISQGMLIGLIILFKEWQSYERWIYVIYSIIYFIVAIWAFMGYEKSKISYRKSMMQCRKEVSEEFKNNWHEFKGSELTWKRDRWITIPQVGLMFIFMVLAILSIVRI
ncbi:hypothetical protein LCGC14_1563440 [marine sediment metagenome]|uniref:Uncharacterized protein n=1 Tax=marine sediment metagenome TaxID=412755 RepID=A0A0F9L355_9ZZZZ